MVRVVVADVCGDVSGDVRSGGLAVVGDDEPCCGVGAVGVLEVVEHANRAAFGVLVLLGWGGDRCGGCHAT